jgi:hypothetical protein
MRFRENDSVQANSQSLSPSLIDAFVRDGVVRIPQAFSPDWIELLREGFSNAMANPSPRHSIREKCYLFLENRTGSDDPDFLANGNVLLDDIYNAKLSDFPAGTDMNQKMLRLAEELGAAGKKPYIVPGGGSNRIGALGYANAAYESAGQYTCDQGLKVDHIVDATGSAGTRAGLATGLTAIHVVLM